MWEFWKSKVDDHISTMDEFIEPLLKEAIAKKHQKKAGVEDSETLLGHLVNSTDGMFTDVAL